MENLPTTNPIVSPPTSTPNTQEFAAEQNKQRRIEGTAKNSTVGCGDLHVTELQDGAPAGPSRWAY